MGFDESVLICDEVDPVLKKILDDNGLKVSYRPEITPQEILGVIADFHIVIVRSRTTITKEMIDGRRNARSLPASASDLTTSTRQRPRRGTYA